MNALTVLCLVLAAGCSRSQLVAYPGVYSYPGILGTYPTLLPQATPITLKTVQPAPITYKAVTTQQQAVSPITYKVASVGTVPAVAPISTVAAVAPVTPVHSKFHAQDELGQYSFGYAGGPSSRAEIRDVFGNIRGSYNYVDPEGKVQTQHYTADGLGFRVLGTNLPVAPDAPAVTPLKTVEDTPEVAAAKVSFKSVHDKVAAFTTQSDAESDVNTPVSRKKRSAAVLPAATYPFTSPLSFAYGYSVPVPYTHSVTPYTAAGFPAITPYTGIPAITPYTGIPAVTPYTGIPTVATKDANLLQIVHNPGHSVSYRVN